MTRPAIVVQGAIRPVIKIIKEGETKLVKVLVPGREGPPGESAYDAAVEEGFQGSKQEWLEGLAGEAGQIAMGYAQEAGESASDAASSAAIATEAATDAAASAASAAQAAADAADSQAQASQAEAAAEQARDTAANQAAQAGIARSGAEAAQAAAEAAAAGVVSDMPAHLAAPDPHPQYTTTEEAIALAAALAIALG